MKNMDFKFTKGIGTGTYSTNSYTFIGSIKNTDYEKDVFHGKCKFSFLDGQIWNSIYSEGNL